VLPLSRSVVTPPSQENAKGRREEVLKKKKRRRKKERTSLAVEYGYQTNMKWEVKKGWPNLPGRGINVVIWLIVIISSFFPVPRSPKKGV
jgi:hypothetical protein